MRSLSKGGSASPIEDSLGRKTTPDDSTKVRISAGKAAFPNQRVEDNAFHLQSIFLRGSCAADQQAHEKINNDRRGNGQEKRTNKGGPVGGPNDPRKYVPVHVIAQTKLAKMHTLGYRTLKAPAPEMIFGDIDCRHRPDQNIVQRHRNRGSDFVAAKNPCYSDRQQRLYRIQRCEPEENSDRRPQSD